MPELTYDMSPSPLAARGEYHPLRFRIGSPDVSRVRYAAAAILRSYYGQPMSLTRWRDAGWLVFGWSRDGASQITFPFRWESICQYLTEHGRFDPA